MKGWKDHPPVYVLVKAFFDMEGKSGDEIIGDNVSVDDKVSKLSAHLVKHGAAGAIPISHRPDQGPAPVFDLDALRSRNATLAKKLKLG